MVRVLCCVLIKVIGATTRTRVASLVDNIGANSKCTEIRLVHDQLRGWKIKYIELIILIFKYA